MPKKIALSFLAAVLFVSAFAPAARAASWQFAGWYGGGCYPMVVPDPKTAGRVFLTSDVAGVWRSEDRGNQWTFKTKGTENLNTATLAIAPSNSKILYTGTKAGVHKSVDAGETWQFLAATRNLVTFKRPDNYKAIAIDRLDPNKVYAGTKEGRVFYTSNGGSTWTRVGSGYVTGAASAVSSLYLSADGTTLFAGMPAGLYRYSRASGTSGSWTKVASLAAKAYDIVGQGTGSAETIFVSAGTRIAYTRDKGATWAYTASISSGRTAFRIAVRTDAGGLRRFLIGWIAGWEGGVYLSGDGGKTWSDAERGLTYDTLGDPTRAWTKGFGKANCVAFDPFNAAVLYFSDWWGVWRSDDGGRTWKERIKGAPNSVVSDIAAAADGIYVASMDNGLMKTTDAGVSYKPLLPTATYNSKSYLGHVWCVLPTGSRIVAASAPWDVNVNQVAISTNGGASFTLAKTGLPAARPTQEVVLDKGYIRRMVADPANPNKIYAALDGNDGGGLYVSSNGGSTWARTPGQPAAKKILHGLGIDPTGPARIYWATFGTGGGIYRTTNGGSTWSKVFSAATYVFSLAVAKDGTVYAGADLSGPVLYVSRDKGTTWALLKRFPAKGTVDAITIDPNNPKRIALSTTRWDDYTGGRIHLSTNGGAAWTDITGNLPEGTGAADAAFSKDGKMLYIGRYAGSVYRAAV